MKNHLSLLGLLAALSLTSAHADCVLRQSTASQEVVLPTFVDSTDGDTAETGLTIANTDIKITKGGGTTQISKNSGGATHIATGDYYTVLDATDTDTVGNLHIKVKVSGALTVWKECVVYEEAIYDALFAASANAFTGAAGSTLARADVISWTGSDLATGTGPLPGLGVLDRGTAQADGTTSGTLRAAAAFGDDELNGATWLVYSATTGAGQRSSISDFVGATDVATLSPALPTDPTGTHRYEIFAVSPAAGSVSIATGGIVAGSFGSGAIDAAALAADAGTELGTATWATAARTLTAFDEDSTTIDINGTTIGTVTTATTATNLTNLPAITANWLTAAGLATDSVAEIVAAQLAAQGTLTGTCDSGSTTTCVDNALNQADATQLEDRLICFDDAWCALITTFTPGSDTATTTKVAPSTRASKVYTIFPTTLE